MLSDDQTLGQTLTPCPELEADVHGISADSLFDGSLHPEHRGADAAAKARDHLDKLKEAQARVAEPQKDLAAESDPGMEVDISATGGPARLAAEAPRPPPPRELPSVPVVSFQRAAGPPRPPGFPAEPENAVG